MKEIIVRYIPLPQHVHAFTLPDAQGDYNIYINDRLPQEQQRLSYAHEKRHIDNDDFFKQCSALEIESLLVDNKN